MARNETKKTLSKDQQQTGAASRFRQHMAGLKSTEQLVDLTAPSGFVYRMARPSRFHMIFSESMLPQLASSAAVTSWQESGIVDEGSIGESDSAKLVKVAFETRDRVLQLSREPKIVMGEAKGANEISADEIPDEDLDFLFKWAASGGSTSEKLVNFPAGS